MSLHIIILAAGQGKRMHSATPKVLHRVGGKPMLSHVVDAASTLSPDAIHVVVGHGCTQIQAALPDLPVHWVFQTEQLGTGHAVLQVLPFIPQNSKVLVLSADVPLIEAAVLCALLQQAPVEASCRPLLLLLAVLDDARGLGRIVRDDCGSLLAIVEE